MIKYEMLLRKLIYLQFKEKLKQTWSTVEIPSHIESLYNKHRQQLAKYHKQTRYWHGTGRYHYKTNGKHKYSRKQNTSEDIDDTLKRIINEGGLVPHFDPWLQNNKQYLASISTSQFRQYSRVYAQLHMSENTTLDIYYGTRQEIIHFLTKYTILSSSLYALFKGITLSFDKTTYANKMPDWAKTINNTIVGKGNAISDLVYVLGECNSNIKGNYGIILGIKNEFKSIPLNNPITAQFETRTTSSVQFSDLSHIEVPLSKIDETQKLLKMSNINIPVIPIELMEIYSSTQPITFEYNKPDQLPILTKAKIREYYKA